MEIRDQCLRARVLFFFKQWGGINQKKAGQVLEDRTWDEMPKVMPVARVNVTAACQRLAAEFVVDVKSCNDHIYNRCIVLRLDRDNLFFHHIRAEAIPKSR